MAVAQKLICKVEKIVNNGEHVYTIDFETERELPRFRPGQFLRLALDDYDPSSFLAGVSGVLHRKCTHTASAFENILLRARSFYHSYGKRTPRGATSLD